MMNKRKLLKVLSTQFDINKTKAKDYDFDMVYMGIEYRIKILCIPKNAQLTVNSSTVWEIGKGKLDGIRFIKSSSDLYRFNGFSKFKNKVVLLSEEPYKILKYVNESDLIDISQEIYIDDIILIRNLKQFQNIF